ncbi:interleukin-1 receptor-like 1 isoform X1 [Anas platyrhynchos]|uniref:interleukin-1 receptor-like 1 isoform X1 n=2 Tax=Anas platyrhynchos TaxID=8839 RepID=UPI000350E57D|nr:interleukin-1 receptor-like 1 isoform X3 [Anas platyrhynchos]XP_005013477.1 interleukin-1 receptor-like 1 isoform X3 [Anas platyrhynchos]XP_005013478.1 interleukin-1 receptor-like 1 isoform X3 [Anas platyrhynchos]|eukprot:XP_005013476.1 interleukin-1 receptor-like 1 isoform X1 [Anas platyrhynchos]
MVWYVHLIFLSTFLLVSVTSESYDAMEGEALVVKCPRRNSAVKVTWYHTDTKKIIPEEEEGSRIFSLGRFLWFLPNSVEDSGNYTCVTHYPNNSTKEFNMSVKVHPYKEGICFPSRILYPNNTRRGEIVCPTFDNYKNATMIQWYKDCRPLHGERYLKKDKYIFISDLTKEDDGYYTCHFTYTHRGNVFNVSATRIFISEAKHLSLPAQILFPKEKDVIEVELGAPLSLKCQARLGIKKQPIDVVTWDVDNNPVIYTDTSRFHEETHFFEGQAREYYKEATLHISEIKEEDLQSNFTCVVVNEMGNTRATVTLQLKAQSDHPNVLMIVGFLVLLVIVAVSVVLYQFFRIDIVLFYREIFQPYSVKDDGKIYDAYVIYPRSYGNEANFVEYFVHQIMPDILENKCGYKLCIYGRDTYPGEDKASAIEKRIQKSRRLIILLTHQLLNCKEFAYDQHVALYNALIQNNTKVILLEMERMETYETLQESLKYIIKKQGTVKWKEQHTVHPQSSNSKFWKRVRYLMPLRLRPSYSVNAG